jgi:hypothetical protein
MMRSLNEQPDLSETFMVLLLPAISTSKKNFAISFSMTVRNGWLVFS